VSDNHRAVRLDRQDIDAGRPAPDTKEAVEATSGCHCLKLRLCKRQETSSLEDVLCKTEDRIRKLTRRGLRGVKHVVSDAHEGIKAAVSKVLSATWQRCRVHFMRNALAHAGKSGRRVVSAFIATAFAQDTPEAASTQWRNVADQIRPKVPKLATLMDSAEQDVLAYMTFPRQHWAKLHSTNPIERLNGEIKRRTEVVGIFPNDDAIVRLVGALLLEQNDEWAVQRSRYMTLETIAAMSDDPLISLPAAS